jgi:hypothetical protein
MLVFAREVFICKCPTAVDVATAADIGPPLRFRQGTDPDIGRLDPRHHGDEDIRQMRERLAAGDYWLIGELDGTIATYSWLSRRRRATYPSLPGCEVRLRPDTAYGYDAWTAPEMRGGGLRRSAFVTELAVERQLWNADFEASFFVKHQLEGATRSLAQVGIEVIPLWRVWLKPDRTLGAERLAEEDDAAVPVFIDEVTE